MLLKNVLALSALVSSGHNLKSHVHCFHPHWLQMFWSSPSHFRHSYLTFPKTSSPPGMCLKWMLSGKTSILKQVKRLKGCQNNAVQSKDVSQAAGIMQNVPGIKDDSCMTPSVPQGGWATFIQQTLLLTQKTVSFFPHIGTQIPLQMFELCSFFTWATLRALRQSLLK